MRLELFLVVRLLLFSFIAFSVAFLATPVLTHFLYKYKFWKTKTRDLGPDGRPTPIFSELHKHKEVGTPRMGGLLVWIVVTAVTFLSVLVAAMRGDSDWGILSRGETWLPLFTLVSAGIIGAVDDLLVIRGKGRYIGGGLSFKMRIFLVLAIGSVGAWWFVSKLGFSTLFVPGLGNLDIGWLYAPLFIVVLLATFSSGVVDGLDGLSGGVFSTIFATYAAIAYVRGQYDLATFCAVLLGALFAYLWFNIPPARFYMGETGIL